MLRAPSTWTPLRGVVRRRVARAHRWMSTTASSITSTTRAASASSDKLSPNRVVYLNGEFVPENQAKISVLDRGFMFSDSVYEVTSVLDGKLVDFDAHMARLERSLRELQFTYTPDTATYLTIHRELLARNGNLSQGVVYWQVTRGVATDRAFTYDNDVPPTVLGMTQAMSLIDHPLAERGLRVVTVPDLRWGRRDIKTTQLLYQSMAKTHAQASSVDDAWMVDPNTGYITEGTSNNVFIVVRNGDGTSTLVTRDLSHDILHGITRAAVLRLCQEMPTLQVDQRSFTVDKAMEDTTVEAFCTSSSNFVMPVVEINGQPIGNGQPGPITRRLREIYIEQSRKHAI